ncbi:MULTISPECIES: hypothetical protein [unclassified Neorhizobium]|uniref:hypothetical protein n=1 Tax=unclassified Neorhizobium TaxID=2629175 RepID=UPI001FF1BC56|nr:MULTISPECIES: hypothetical protein [unclassified Neorhizobium]MCJ9671594.1 hypothetical protein [Neorhizobium sp. SHOUNA12B]MCJ9747723.1 hypothetical protein [Neorhizobium sp. SHOUNA12A]
MDEISGDGHAELLDNGSIEIAFRIPKRRRAVLKAQPETSSTACEVTTTAARRHRYGASRKLADKIIERLTPDRSPNSHHTFCRRHRQRCSYSYLSIPKIEIVMNPLLFLQ